MKACSIDLEEEELILSEEQQRSLSKELVESAKLVTSKEAFLESIRQRAEPENVNMFENIIQNIISNLAEKSGEIQPRVRFTTVGSVHRIGNGVATVSGLPDVSIDEIVTFPTGVEGMALNLDRKHVDLIMLGSDQGIRGGDLVQATGKRLQVPVGSQLLGRVVNPLGKPIDRDEIIEASEHRHLSKIAPGVVERTPVNESLFTGTKMIDTLFPIGRGQRELILGDRQTGKTTLAVDAILNQKHTGVRCVYVAIGQKKSSTLSVIETLREKDVMSNTIVVMSSSDDPPALRYLAPYAGMTMAEYFLDQGQDVLIVFDDLSKHADAYRELSLLLRRPPGREAYPGDIFYIHSRLLERACRLKQSNGGGSITALPIATTQNGNISAYITTNLISITDGQLVLDTDLFNQEQKPAIDIGRSVSRVGGAAQKPAMRRLVGNLKLELSQYKEVEHFTRFGTEVDETTRRQINKGQRILNILKQQPNKPYSYSMTIVVLYALNAGHFDQVPINDVENYENSLIDFFLHRENKLLIDIRKETHLSESITNELDHALSAFNQYWLEIGDENK
ncbi:MAG TPA: F0F1 ATP synthase subunit alpha [Brevefilum fermentans]|jgi:F-type H+-transporting ATPase subunit alpha|uniref:ATP synthase subunit alpha n=1 Tax=Candidatus Brevifilum fermentans TaxID=1986204 RepID=A0A1Y6K6P5_9CHLR|nr:F0F1 ATP synthase subunit alpha [Brevefilum fermentans]MDI9566795.1 F0F1 ATP synthase subunit alpha [Chloroflexota bacterium]SMX54527.1 F1 sector of membrane-bound ATP synthase, alpha subunit [Brevefilum fermentans]HQA29137.1 F0F1 ATP synthase subunit alpha [Brevefilum fermentans]